MQFIRCSAWFGSVRLVLVPETFMRLCFLVFKKLKMIDLRVRFQPIEVFQLLLNGALFRISKPESLIRKSEFRIRFRFRENHSDSVSASGRRLDSRYHGAQMASRI